MFASRRRPSVSPRVQVTGLKAILDKFSLTKTGKKAVLVKRLLDAGVEEKDCDGHIDKRRKVSAGSKQSKRKASSFDADLKPGGWQTSELNPLVEAGLITESEVKKYKGYSREASWSKSQTQIACAFQKRQKLSAKFQDAQLKMRNGDVLGKVATLTEDTNEKVATVHDQVISPLLR